MFSINRDSGIIVINRGDSFSFPLFINSGTPLVPIRYSLLEDSTSEVYLGVCSPNKRFEEAIIKKKYTSKDVLSFNSNGDLVVSFSSSDTENLLAGLYYYEVKLRTITNAEKLSNSITITSSSLIKSGSKLARGSKLNGVEVTLPEGEIYYTLTSDEVAVASDVITVNSILVNGTVINNIPINAEDKVNTVIPKTKFIIEE